MPMICRRTRGGLRPPAPPPQCRSPGPGRAVPRPAADDRDTHSAWRRSSDDRPAARGARSRHRSQAARGAVRSRRARPSSCLASAGGLVHQPGGGDVLDGDADRSKIVVSSARAGLSPARISPSSAWILAPERITSPHWSCAASRDSTTTTFAIAASSSSREVWPPQPMALTCAPGFSQAPCRIGSVAAVAVTITSAPRTAPRPS